MPKQTLIKKNFSFIGGINTDSGYLQQVPNSWSDGDNMVPFLDGHIARRNKIDLELDFVLGSSFNSNTKSTGAFGVYPWKNVGGNGRLTFAVVQIAGTLLFYDCSSASISPNIKSFSIDLSVYKSPTTANVFGTSLVSVDDGNGKLVVVSADTDPILVSYDSASDTITTTRLTLKIRDFYGLPDTTPITTNPALLTSTHDYNLQNQGWTSANITSYFSTNAVYPDDTQIWLQGKDASDVFSPSLLDKQDFGTSAAPKGRFILNAFNRDRTTVSGVLGLTSEVEPYRPSVVCFFAGRAWYSGILSNVMGSWVMFSRIADTNIKYEQCYQEGDPTAEYTNDLIASDGGVIQIPGAGGILAMKSLQDSLIIFAQNGIWQILGGSTTGFTADSYQLKQIASFGIRSGKSVVEVENTLLFWTSSGIYTLVKDNVSGDWQPKSLSLGKIQSLYSDIIQNSNEDTIHGFYDSIERVVYWMYDQSSEGSSNNRFGVKNMLLLDTTLGSFYTYSLASLATTTPLIVGGFLSPNSGNQELVASVIDSSGYSVVTGTSDVIMTTVRTVVAPKIPKFLTIVPNGSGFSVSFSDFINLENAPYKFRDWYSFDHIGAETEILPFLTTGYDLVDDGAKDHQAPYVITHLLRTETGFDDDYNALNESSCTLQGRWEFTDNASASRWTAGEQVYRHRTMYVPESTSDTFATGYPVISSKSIIRGKGKALQLKYSSASGKDMQIAGWAIQFIVVQNV